MSQTEELIENGNQFTYKCNYCNSPSINSPYCSIICYKNDTR